MTRKLTPREELDNQLLLGQCRVGPEAAREIARRITSQHGFWDYAERKRAQRAQTIRPVLTLLPGGHSADKAA
jgi:hypothetical protein